MHIALFTPAWPLESFHNGIVTYVRWMREEFVRLGHKVSVFTNQNASTTPDPDVHKVERTEFAAFRYRLALKLGRSDSDPWAWADVIASAVGAVHRRDPIDILEMEESFGWSAAVEAATGIPVLAKLHGPAFLSLMEEELDKPDGRERVLREGRALEKSGGIASPSTDTLERTLARYRLSPAVCEHVVNAIDVEAEVPLWQLEASEPETLLLVGRFDRRKGADIALEAFEILLRRRPTLKLILVGPDEGLLLPDGRRIHFESFRDARFPASLRDRIEFRGRMANAAIAELRCRARAVVVASRWENQGYAALEAMLQGCPIVASNVGGNPESIVHDQTGLLFRNEDPADLAIQLARLLDEPDTAARLGAAARRHVIEHHSAARVAPQALALYERVIAHAGR